MSDATNDPRTEGPAGKNCSKLRWVLRHLRRLVVFTGVCLLLFVVGLAIYGWDVNRRGETAVANVRQALVDRDLLDRYIDAQPKPDADGFAPEETGTSAALWRAAMQVMPEAGDRPLPAVAVVAYTGTEPRQQYHPDVIAAMREAVDEGALFYELIDRARSAEFGPFLPQNALEEIDKNIGLLGDARAVARWLQVKGCLAEAENDGAGFVEAYLAAFALNENLQPLPNVIDDLVRISIDALIREGIIEGLSRIELTSEQLDALMAGLEQREQFYRVEDALGLAISAEYHQMTSHVQERIAFNEAKRAIAMRDLPAEVDLFFDLPEEPGPIRRAWDDLMLSWCPGRYELMHAEQMSRALREYDQIMALMGKPVQQWKAIEGLMSLRWV